MALLHERTAQNVATFVPYGNVRTLALGFGERTPNDYQLVDIQGLVAQGMADGAAGLSTGLDYVDQCFASTDELVAAARGMRAQQGIYVTHVRYARGHAGRRARGGRDRPPCRGAGAYLAPQGQQQGRGRGDHRLHRPGGDQRGGLLV